MMDIQYSKPSYCLHSPGDSVSKVSVPLRQTLMNQKVIVAKCDDFETAREKTNSGANQYMEKKKASLVSLSVLNDVDLDLLIVTKHLS